MKKCDYSYEAVKKIYKNFKENVEKIYSFRDKLNLFPYKTKKLKIQQIDFEKQDSNY